MLIDLLCITIICVFIIDFSGIIESLESFIGKLFNIKSPQVPKPFSCSLCMTFWLGLLYVCLNNLTIFNIMLVCLFAASTQLLYNLIQVIYININKLLEKIS